MFRNLLFKPWLGCVAVLLVVSTAFSADGYIGEYKGTYKADKSAVLKSSGKVIVEGPGYYRVMLEVLEDKSGQEGFLIEIYGVRQGNMVNLFGRSQGRNWTGAIKDGKILATADYYIMDFELERTVRKSPTEGAKPPDGAIVLLPFEPGKKSDVSEWESNNEHPAWVVLDDGTVQIGKSSPHTKRKFKDVKLHLEFFLPLEPDNFFQHRSNSGVFLNGKYEVQVLDSFGFVPSTGDCGAIYNFARPMVNASLPPHTWQTYDIIFRAPRMGLPGEVKELPRITVFHNGIKIHDNVEIPAPTADPEKPHVEEGPLELQDHGHPVRYRNIWIVELESGSD